jgi:adenosylhomocysteine nucleosidase
MLNPSPSVFFFVALPTEAKPFIRHWRLRKCTESRAFECYLHPDVVLTVSGMGRTAMAAAVAFALTRFPCESPVLVNFGLAGHATAPIGELLWAGKITDVDSAKVFYPQLAIKNTLPISTLHTYARPNGDYRVASMYDMEASGFYEIATKWSSGELIHVLKLISDNREQPMADSIDRQWLEGLIEAHVEEVAAFVRQLQSLRAVVLGHRPQWPEVALNMHFSVSQTGQMNDLMRRCAVLAPQGLDWSLAPQRSSKVLIDWLQKQLQALPARL